LKLETEAFVWRRRIFILSALALIPLVRAAAPPGICRPPIFPRPAGAFNKARQSGSLCLNRPEIAGDLLLATNLNGDFFLQFSKMPFPLATAQVSGDQWQIDLARTYSWHGHGTPPTRFVWFQLPRVLRDPDVGGDWQFIRVETNSWRLENSRTGETLEGEFFP